MTCMPIQRSSRLAEMCEEARGRRPDVAFGLIQTGGRVTRIKAGMVHVNDYTVLDDARAPFGGVGYPGTLLESAATQTSKSTPRIAGDRVPEATASSSESVIAGDCLLSPHCSFLL